MLSFTWQLVVPFACCCCSTRPACRKSQAVSSHPSTHCIACCLRLHWRRFLRVARRRSRQASGGPWCLAVRACAALLQVFGDEKPAVSFADLVRGGPPRDAPSGWTPKAGAAASSRCCRFASLVKNPSKALWLSPCASPRLAARFCLGPVRRRRHLCWLCFRPCTSW